MSLKIQPQSEVIASDEVVRGQCPPYWLLLSRDEVDVMLGIELEQTRVYREAEEKGNVKGRQEEAQGLILRQLNRRVGNVSSDLEARVKTLPLMQLEELGEALLDFSQMNDLVDWLDMNRSPA
jgi:Domain of unknown function (DUF4351)